MLQTTNLNKEEVLEAIKEGVCKALLTAMEAGDGYSGPIIRASLIDAITEGVKEAILEDLITSRQGIT